MTDKPVSEMTLDEILAHAKKTDEDKAAEREAARLRAMGIKPPKTSWDQSDHEATARRVAAAEARRQEAAKLPDARTMTDQEFQEACRKAGINVSSALM